MTNGELILIVIGLYMLVLGVYVLINIETKHGIFIYSSIVIIWFLVVALFYYKI